jgi:hypothetical protein
MKSKTVSHFPYCPEDIDPWPFTSLVAPLKMVSMQADNTNWNPNPTLYYPRHREDGTPVPDLQQLLLQKPYRGNRPLAPITRIIGEPFAPITRIIGEPFAPICVESLMAPVKCSCGKGIYCSVCSYESRFLNTLQELPQMRKRAQP